MIISEEVKQNVPTLNKFMAHPLSNTEESETV